MSPTMPSYDKQVRYWRLSKDVLGSGSTSTVLRATHVKLPTLCAAVKVISRSGLLAKAKADSSSLHLVDTVINREILLMKLAQHERIVRLYDFVHRGDLVYLVMEHAPHKTLYDLFRASSSYLPRSLVVRIFSQLMHGLAYVHALHIVHRDLKLENVFIFGPDVKALLQGGATAHIALNIKIGDFGLAHVDDPNKLSTVFHGSPHYQAPEVWLRVPHHPFPTDVWSAGVILYALLCRRLPFDLTSLQNANIPSGDQTYLAKFQSRGSNTKRFKAPRERELYMPYDSPGIIYPAADNLLRKIFAYDPAMRPTARRMLWDDFFDEVPGSDEKNALHNTSVFEVDSQPDRYDLSTLRLSIGRWVPHAIEKLWAQRPRAHERRGDTWDVASASQRIEGQRREHTRLGKKNKEVQGHKVVLTLPRSKSSTLLLCNCLSPKVDIRLRDGLREGTPHTAQGAPFPVASVLQDRREALLRRAYELGFGTEDLRAFADEACTIVHVAQEGNWTKGLEDIAREVERRSFYDPGSSNDAGAVQYPLDICLRHDDARMGEC